MGDLYKCKKCGQLCYGVSVSEVDGNLAAEILGTIEADGMIESADSIPFLDSDFSQFMQKRVGIAAVRYEAYTSFQNVMNNMRHDKVVIGTKRIEDGYMVFSCPICQSHEFFSMIGSLPTTFVDGHWDDYVDSDHTWYLLSDSNGGNGSFTELERRELTNYVLREDREDAQVIYDEVIKECYESVIKKKSGFAQTKDVDLTQYFRTLMNVKTDIQAMENRLFDLILSQLPADRAFINSTCRKEETIVNEIDKEKNQIFQQVEKLRRELEFHVRDDWREANGIMIPQEPVKPVLEKPQEPEFKQPGLFNRKEIMSENDALRSDYTARLQEYNAVLSSYTEAMNRYRAEKETYERRKDEIYQRELNAWENDPDNIARRQKLQELTARDDELNGMLKNPMEYAQKMLENSGPAKVKRLYDDEIERNAGMLKKAYQTEADLQNVLFVFPKYLDIVAVSKIYEYLVTGRVTSLTGANGAYTLYESEMRNNRTPGLNGVSRRTENIVAREFTIYNALTSVSKIMNEIGQKTDAAVNELRTSNDTEAGDEYRNSANAFYSLIEEDLKICDEYSRRYIASNVLEQNQTDDETLQAEAAGNAEALPEVSDGENKEAGGEEAESAADADTPELPITGEDTEPDEPEETPSPEIRPEEPEDQ